MPAQSWPMVVEKDEKGKFFFETIPFYFKTSIASDALPSTPTLSLICSHSSSPSVLPSDVASGPHKKPAVVCPAKPAAAMTRNFLETVPLPLYLPAMLQLASFLLAQASSFKPMKADLPISVEHDDDGLIHIKTEGAMKLEMEDFDKDSYLRFAHYETAQFFQSQFQKRAALFHLTVLFRA